MTKYRNNLPQLTDHIFLTDGGIETTLIFHEGLELPDFAAFYLLNNPAGYQALQNYYRTYAALARKYGTGFILESPTWRSSPDWGKRLGYRVSELIEVNCKAIELLVEIRREFENEETQMVISGCIGPRGDGYNPSDLMSAAEAQQYHALQINTFRETEADMVTAITMNYIEEAIGITRAAQSAGLPVAISFTVETDGNLPTGHTLKEAIERVDEATNYAPVYYMINCAHPAHFEDALLAGELWLQRIRGIRANASTKSHAELNESAELDEGNPVELGNQYRELFAKLPNLTVMGGCCGTDHRHVEEICKASVALHGQRNPEVDVRNDSWKVMRRLPLLKTVQLPGEISLCYTEQGDPGGVPVLFLHGVTDSLRSFEPVLPFLPDSIHAFAVTQRGHGDSSHPATGYRFYDFAADVAAFMDAINLKKAVIVGHSMGSVIAQRFALDYPDRILGLALIGTFASLANNPGVQEFWDTVIATLTEPVSEDVVREFQQSTLAQPIPQNYFETVVQESLKVPARVWRAAFTGFLQDDFKSEIGNIQSPTFIVWGDKDIFCPERDQHFLASAISDAQLAVYSGAGHAVHWEYPERFAADLIQFIENITKQNLYQMSPAA
jgi:S-methylmethionine-dependent homocysteine/selenocysteine methylase/pimeloyl-ACP methyl ester carboxylesterase